MENSQPGPAVSGVVVSTSQVRRLAVAAYLARYKGQSRVHTESDLRGYLTWCEPRPRPARRHPAAHRALRAVDAGGPPVQALHGLPPALGRRRLLPDLRHRRRA